jgi:hypothetical protein
MLKHFAARAWRAPSGPRRPDDSALREGFTEHMQKQHDYRALICLHTEFLDEHPAPARQV